jgi:O-acetyl-ADP-ribose deacetylase
MAHCKADASSSAGNRAMNTVLRAVHADITTLAVDVIVNAANPWLGGGDPDGPGGGVDGAIHRAAGPELLEACRPLGGCKTGEAKLTPAFRLPSRYVVHTVGPVWKGGRSAEFEMLSSCYRSSLEIVSSMGLGTVAFPCISSGSYGFPLELAAATAIDTVSKFVAAPSSIREVIFCCFLENEMAVYEQLLHCA